MSLLTIARSIAEEIGLPPPSSLATSNDRTARQLLRLINKSGKIIAKKNWKILIREHVFDTSAGASDYPLPLDFRGFVAHTAWNRSEYAALRGPMSPIEWQAAKSSRLASILHSSFRIKPVTRRNRFWLDPTPTVTQSFVFEYYSTNWATDIDNTQDQPEFQKDTDVALISEELIEHEALWRFLNRRGFAYAEEKIEAERELENALAEDMGSAVIDLGARRAGFPVNIPEGNFNV